MVEESVGRSGQSPPSGGMVVLSEAECWSLLRRHSLGRLAIVVDGRPRVFPVNYGVGDGMIVVKTQAGSKVSHGPGNFVGFEIDGYDERSATGWSVMVSGLLDDVSSSDDERSQRARSVPVHPVAPGKKTYWLALLVDEISGRSFSGGWTVPGQFLG
jgi:nitroimidazol reductase NimA-like FMN-containing flavoprotein (pyridoxamine 5'-phosphate oxidase superfamily)